MARFSEEGLHHARGVVKWEDIARVRITHNQYPSGSTRILVRAAGFKGSLYPSASQMEATLALIEQNVPRERIILDQFSNTWVILDLAIWVYLIFGPLPAFLLLLVSVVYRWTRPVKPTWRSEWALLMMMVAYGAIWALESIERTIR